MNSRALGLEPVGGEVTGPRILNLSMHQGLLQVHPLASCYPLKVGQLTDRQKDSISNVTV